MEDIPQEVWAWVRREMPDPEFRSWLWQAPANISLILGPVYDDLVSGDYVDASTLSRTKDRLASTLPRKCLCHLFANRQWLGIWQRTAPATLLALYSTVRQRTPWLYLLRCKACSHYWYVAYDTVDDGWYFERLTREQAWLIAERNEWPSTFDDFKNVWPEDGSARSNEAPRGFLSGIAMEFLSDT